MDRLSYDANHVYREGYNDALWDFLAMMYNAKNYAEELYGVLCIEAYYDAFSDIEEKMEGMLSELKLLQPEEN